MENRRRLICFDGFDAIKLKSAYRIGAKWQKFNFGIRKILCTLLSGFGVTTSFNRLGFTSIFNGKFKFSSNIFKIFNFYQKKASNYQKFQHFMKYFLSNYYSKKNAIVLPILSRETTASYKIFTKKYYQKLF